MLNLAAWRRVADEYKGWLLCIKNMVPDEMNFWEAEGYVFINRGRDDEMWREWNWKVEGPSGSRKGAEIT